MPVFPLPAENQGLWIPQTEVGIPGGIAQYAAGGVNDRAVTGTLVDMAAAPYNCDPTGAINCRDALAQAILDASGPTVLYFPAGTYLFSSGFIPSGYKDEITIRGSGVGTTTFHLSTIQSIIGFDDPGSTGSNIQTITGAKTKDTATLAVADSSEYVVDRIAFVQYENEYDETRIIAGAPPTFHSNGSPWIRQMLCRVTAMSSGLITINPPLPYDGTGLEMRISTAPFNSSTNWWGFEDFSVTFDPATHPTQFAVIQNGSYNWMYRVHFEDWSRDAFNGSCIRLFSTYRGEIRKCRFDAVDDSSSDGAIETTFDSLCLIEDNIFTGPWGYNVYESGNSCSCVFSYNFFRDGTAIGLHNAHPNLLLTEGCWGIYYIEDGYHGSSAYNTVNNSNFDLIVAQRFKRNDCFTGNQVGIGFSFGNPNIGNSNAEGFAGPTGLSDQEGELDIIQPGYGLGGGSPYTYVIQPEDIFVGDFWVDWQIAGELVDRISDTEGTFQVSGGNWFVGVSASAGNRLYPTARWNSDVDAIGQGEVTNVAGDMVTIEWVSGVLPAESTVVKFYMFATGYQERDLDVQASCTFANNTVNGVLQNDVSPDTVAPSYMYGAKPFWWDEDGVLAWPAVMTTPLAFPAGARYYAGEPPAAPVFTVDTVISGAEQQTSTLTASTPTVTGNPPPTVTRQWKRDGVDIPGETGPTYLLVGADVGTIISVVFTAENGIEPGDVSSDSTGVITAFEGDILVVTQVANASPVTELWLRGLLTDGVSSIPEHYLVQHSGPYPTQPDNNFVYQRFGTPQDHVYVFQGTVTEAEAIASVP